MNIRSLPLLFALLVAPTAFGESSPDAELERYKRIFDDRLDQSIDLAKVRKLGEFYQGHLEELRDDRADAGRDPSEALRKELERARLAKTDPAEAIARARRKPLQLDTFWNKYSGSEEALADFQKALGSGPEDVNLKRDDTIEFPLGGHYLQYRKAFLAEIEGLDQAQNFHTSNKDVRHPGWPHKSFTTSTYTGSFRYGGRKFNSMQIVMDGALQVVAFQLKNDGALPPRAHGEPTPGYFNFVSSRRKSNPRTRTYSKTTTEGDLVVIQTTFLSQDRKLLEQCLLFVPEPVAACCRSIGD